MCSDVCKREVGVSVCAVMCVERGGGECVCSDVCRERWG